MSGLLVFSRRSKGQKASLTERGERAELIGAADLEPVVHHLAFCLPETRGLTLGVTAVSKWQVGRTSATLGPIKRPVLRRTIYAQEGRGEVPIRLPLSRRYFPGGR